MPKKVLITSALPYANGPLHFGHIAGAYLPGDCYARFQRLIKNDVLYICGSDEYGVAITLSAELAKRSPKEHVDIFHEVNLNFFKKLNFSFDHYSRTTWDGHSVPVHRFFKEILDNGYIEEKVTDNLFSVEDQRFLADRYVVGECPGCTCKEARGDECPKCGASFEAQDLKNPRSKLSGAKLILKPTKHWFLRLDLFKDRLLKWLETKKWKPNVVNFVKKYIEDLRERAITRDSEWGVPIPLPNTQGKVLYVWFEACIGYISATREWAKKIGKPDEWKTWWLDSETKLVNFIGKDNIPFHAVIFPAMIMGQNQSYKLVDELPANEFLMLEGRQFSKSDGWYIDLEDFFSKFTADQIRYNIASNAPETSDAEFTWRGFQKSCNADLLGKYGNLVNRVLVFAGKQTGGLVPRDVELQEIDKEFLQKILDTAQGVYTAYDKFSLRQASKKIMELSQLGNAYFDAKKPWLAAKDENLKSSMETTIYCCLECLKLLALTSFPIIPDTAEKLWKMLGFKTELEKDDWRLVVNTKIEPKQKLMKPAILFRKVEDSEIELEIEKLHKMAKNKQKVEKMANKELVDIDAVKKLDLRVGQITMAEPIEKSNRLLKLEVDLGFEKRQVVAGIKKNYTPEQIIGKKIVLVANLKPAILMGVESQGMILAASNEETFELISIQDLPPGSVVS